MHRDPLDALLFTLFMLTLSLSPLLITAWLILEYFGVV